MNPVKTTETGLLKFKNLDAMPGNTLAKILGIQHTKLMRTIKRTIKSEEKRKKDVATDGFIFSAIFKDYEYRDAMNRKQKTYLMNEDALYLVIANTQSKKAHKLKVLFKSEFNKMREERKAREEIKQYQRTYTDTVQELEEALIQDGSKHAKLIYSTVQRQVNKCITGRSTPRGQTIESYRETLSRTQLQGIKRLENVVMILIDHFLSLGATGRTTREVVKRFLNGECGRMWQK